MRRASPGRAVLEFFKDEKKSLLLGVVLVLAMQLIEFHGWLAAPEGKLLDTYLRLGSGASSGPAPIVTVEIDDAAYESCFHGSPMDPITIHDLLTPLIGTRGESHPAVVGVDIITDSHLSYQPLRELTGTVADFTKLVWIAPVAKASPYAPTFRQWLFGAEDEFTVEPGNILGYTPEQARNAGVQWAVPMFPTDEDLRLRRFPRKILDTSVSEEKNTWAATIAADYHRVDIAENVPAVILPFGTRLRKQYAIGDLFYCSKNGDPAVPATVTARDDALRDYRKILAERDYVLLLGGTFEAGRDEYQTPNGPESGLLINARAIEAERANNGIKEAPQVALFGLDLIVCVAIVAAFSKGREIRAMMHRALPLVPIALALSFIAFKFGYIWMSVIGIAIGFMPHLLMEIYNKNPRAPVHHHKSG